MNQLERQKTIKSICAIYPQYSEKQLQVFEKHVYSYFLKQVEKKRKSPDVSNYRTVWYDILGHLGNESDVNTLKQCIRDIHAENIYENHTMFKEYRDTEKEEDHFLLHPFTVEEGVLECSRCGGKRTISYQKQTRSADEGSTTFAKCVDCNKQWRHNN